jgi:hypothetical protein
MTVTRKDWMYALVVRHVAEEDFGDRLAALAHADGPLVRLRARFVLDVRVQGHAEHLGPLGGATAGRLTAPAAALPKIA